ncbi:MAG: pitrilysin family protein [bacterium]
MKQKTVFSMQILGCIALVILFFTQSLQADTDDIFKKYLEDQVYEFTLDNGIKFILVERPEIPVFSAILQVGAGSVDEPQGKTGIAHVFEHMAFKGTTSIGTRDYQAEKVWLDRIENLGARLTELKKDSSSDPEEIENQKAELKETQQKHREFAVDNELDELYSRNGANFLNAGTGRDSTTYMVSLPANRLELWARIEVDRLLNPVFRQFYEERDVIMEERRMGTDNSASGDLYEEFFATAFRVSPYGKPVIGWMHDIENLTIEDARSFHDAHYVPENITVAIAGDISPQQLREVADKYFAHIPRREPPEAPDLREPPQNHVRIVRVRRDDATPEIILGWHIPKYPHKSAIPLDIAASILGSGRTSRLYKRLVETGMAIGVNAGADTLGRYDSLFTIEITPVSGVDEQEIIDATLGEIQNLAENPLTQFEVDKIKKQELVSFVKRLNGNMWLAMQLAYFENITGSWRSIGQYLRDVNACSREEVSEAVGEFLKSTNYTMAVLEKIETETNVSEDVLGEDS